MPMGFDCCQEALRDEENNGASERHNCPTFLLSWRVLQREQQRVEEPFLMSVLHW